MEDEPLLAKIVKESLESRDFIVTLVEDGAEAIATFEMTQPDICVLDIMLPNKDGYAIGKEIRSLNPVMPIIFLTAKSETTDVLKGFTAGGNDYIKKPFSMEELIVRIRNLIGMVNSTLGPEPTEIMLGAFTFIPSKFELHYDGESRKLSNRENHLLHILTRRRNIPVRRKTILQEIWGNDSIFNSRNLDVYITRLRGYLKADPTVQIQTLKGVGYQFLVED